MEEMLNSFTETLSKDDYRKALSFKSKLENEGGTSDAIKFRVSLVDKWKSDFEHPSVASHQFVKDQLEDMWISEQNLNRDTNSEPQLDIFLDKAKQVKTALLQKYGDKEFKA